MYKKVLVTGGAGFIGSHLSDKLLREGRQVKILVRDRKYNQIEKNRLENMEAKGGRLVFGDLRVLKSLKEAVRGVECVYHLGAVSRPMKILKQEYYDNSVLGTKNILLAGINAGIKKFIHVSTVSVLGVSPNGVPLSEEDYQPEDMTYATSKLVSEKLALEYCSRYKIPVVVIRPCLTYGPRCMVRLIMFRFVKNGIFPLFNGGRAKMEFLYVDNVISALLSAERNQKVNGEIFNITDGKSYEIGEVLRTIAGQLGVKPRFINLPLPLGVAAGYAAEFVSSVAGVYPPFSRTAADWMANSRNIYDCHKAKKLLGYKPVISLDEGISRTVAWFRKYNLL